MALHAILLGLQQAGADVADRPDAGSGGKPFGLPGLDLGEMMAQFQVPGVDLGALMDRGRDDMEALRQANQAMVEGFTALARKQGEIFRQTLEEWRRAASEGRAPSPQEGFETALGNMRELAEIAAESQVKAAEIVRERVEANLRGLFQPAAGQVGPGPTGGMQADQGASGQGPAKEPT